MIVAVHENGGAWLENMFALRLPGDRQKSIIMMVIIITMMVFINIRDFIIIMMIPILPILHVLYLLIVIPN